MEETSGGGVAHAVKDGLARAASAPAVLAGTLVLTFVLGLLATDAPIVAGVQYLAVRLLTPFSGTFHVRGYEALAWLLVWSFLSGGILDRLARGRPTRGRGFFAACGAHLPAMLRLGVVDWLVWLATARQQIDGPPDYVRLAFAVAAGLLLLYARVRLVIEDRRSAIGAILAGGRFIRRNPGAAAIFLVFTAALWAIGGRPVNRLADALVKEYSWWAFVQFEGVVALLLFVVFASWASAASLFQARLAHASYTAGPPLEWPESPAAEAITNLSAAPIP